MKAELTLPERPAAVHLLAVLDILVLLLVFFVLLTSLAQEAGVTVRPPVSSFRLKSYGERIVVTVRMGGAEPIVYVGPQRFSFGDFEGALVAAAEEKDVETMFLNADETLPYGVAREIQEIGLGLGLNVVLIGRPGGEEAASEDQAGSANPASPGTDEKTEP